jgi:hypothetical protein
VDEGAGVEDEAGGGGTGDGTVGTGNLGTIGRGGGGPGGGMYGKNAGRQLTRKAGSPDVVPGTMYPPECCATMVLR